MKEGFTFRYVNEIAGTFVLATVALLVVGIYLAGHAQGWFEPKLRLCTQLSARQGSRGLQKGAEVRIMDTLAGRVTRVTPTEVGGMKVVFEVNGEFQPLIRDSSVVKVRKKFGVAGDPYIEVVPGDRKGRPVRHGDYLPFQEEPDMMQYVMETVQDVRESLVPVLDDARQIVGHVNDILGAVNAMEGPVGRFVHDTEMGENVAQMMRDLRETTGQLPGIASNAAAITKDTRTITAMLAGDVAALEDLMAQTQRTLRETEKLLEGLQRHWLLRRYMEQKPETDLISPLDMPPLEGGKR